MSEKIDYENLTQNERSYYLEKAVLTGTPEEVAELLDNLGEVEYTAEAMMYACRFMGLPYVRVLTEKGCKFQDAYIGEMKIYGCILDIPKYFHGMFRDMSDEFSPNINIGKKKNFTLLPFKERAKILGYLLDNREKTCFDAETALFYAILVNDDKMYEELKVRGAAFSQDLIKLLTEGGRNYLWEGYVIFLSCNFGHAFVRVIDKILKETGTEKPLHFTDGLYAGICVWFYWDDIFPYILEHFNQKKMNKSYIMKVIIRHDAVKLLVIAAENGWLRMPSKRDEMIDYAAECKSAECAAWLLDYKERTADRAKEAKNKEKREQRELNASPDSVLEQKKIWNYKKREDGTLIITGYKGREKEVTVPEKIGKSTVTAIGEYAFSPYAPRLQKKDNYDPAKVRREITKVTLPNTVKEIGNRAFYCCSCLRYVNIPLGVEKILPWSFYGCMALEKADIPNSVIEIEEYAFCDCCNGLKSITIPDSVKVMGKCAFYRCRSLMDIRLSGSVEKLENELFAGCKALEKIQIPEGVREISKKVFDGCVGLKSVRFPMSLKKINNFTDSKKNVYKVFDSEADVTAEVPSGSYAEKYCKRNEIAYVNY